MTAIPTNKYCRMVCEIFNQSPPPGVLAYFSKIDVVFANSYCVWLKYLREIATVSTSTRQFLFEFSTRTEGEIRCLEIYTEKLTIYWIFEIEIANSREALMIIVSDFSIKSTWCKMFTLSQSSHSEKNIKIIK